jgi:hypothetical protein
MSIVFSNRWVIQLRVHDARYGFGNIQKHRVMIYERGNRSNKVRNSFDGVRNSFDGVQKCFGEVQKYFGVAGN